jgi:Ni/Co efflux regulator RcnB
MKKLIICLAVATVAVSCKKIQAGGNKNTLKLEEGMERYSDDPQGEAHGHSHEAAAEHKEEATAEKHEGEAPKADSATATAKPTEAQTPKAEH